jgi:cytoskeleton protein RodZ
VTTTAQTQPASTARGNELTLRFSGDSWAEIYDSRGNRLFYDIGSADSVKTLSGSPPYRVVLGNPGGVAVEVNGKSARIPNVRGGESGIQFTINNAGRVSKARAAPNAGG